jgi:hypothetical protein
MATASPTKKLMKTPVAKAAAAPEPEKTATKVAVKTAAAKSAKAEPVEKPEVDANDMIVKTAHEIENMKADKAFSLVPTLLDNIEHDYFRLGGVLSKMNNEGWYMEKGYETFKAYVEAECGINYRKAMYWIAIYNGLVESGVAWEKVKHLGWTKLKELAGILSAENVDDWVAVAESMTVLQLQEHIKQSTKGIAAGDSTEGEEGGGDTNPVTTKTFKLHTDQKQTVTDALEKAKHLLNTESDTVALEHICMEYLSGGKGKVKPQSLSEVMKDKSMEEVLQVVGEAFPKLVLQATLYDSVEEAQAAQAELETAEEATEE